MSGSGSTPTKPVPAPRRGSKPKELPFKTQFGNFKSGWISLENVFVAFQKRRNVAKVGQPTENELFLVLEEEESFFAPQEFALHAERRLETVMRCFRKLEKKLNTPTDNEQLLRLKRMSKSPLSNPLLRDLAL